MPGFLGVVVGGVRRPVCHWHSECGGAGRRLESGVMLLGLASRSFSAHSRFHVPGSAPQGMGDSKAPHPLRDSCTFA